MSTKQTATVIIAALLVVSGAAALVWSNRQQSSPVDSVQIVQMEDDKIGNTQPQVVSGGEDYMGQVIDAENNWKIYINEQHGVTFRFQDGKSDYAPKWANKNTVVFSDAKQEGIDIHLYSIFQDNESAYTKNCAQYPSFEEYLREEYHWFPSRVADGPIPTLHYINQMKNSVGQDMYEVAYEIGVGGNNNTTYKDHYFVEKEEDSRCTEVNILDPQEFLGDDYMNLYNQIVNSFQIIQTNGEKAPDCAAWQDKQYPGVSSLFPESQGLQIMDENGFKKHSDKQSSFYYPEMWTVRSLGDGSYRLTTETNGYVTVRTNESVSEFGSWYNRCLDRCFYDLPWDAAACSEDFNDADLGKFLGDGYIYFIHTGGLPANGGNSYSFKKMISMNLVSVSYSSEELISQNHSEFKEKVLKIIESYKDNPPIKD